jgi:hypothetical protein
MKESPTPDGTTPQNVPTEPGRHRVQVTSLRDIVSKTSGKEMIVVSTEVLESSAPANVGLENAQVFGKEGNFRKQNAIMLANVAAACGLFDALSQAFPGDGVSILDEAPVAWLASHLPGKSFIVTDEQKGERLNWVKIEPDSVRVPAPPPVAPPPQAAPNPTAQPPSDTNDDSIPF